ncbi:MAG: DUF1501 domain-containing protein [Candidatus Sedimenticola sp. 6PFRAG7]
MNRRDFIKLLGGAGMAGAFPGVFMQEALAADPFAGLALINIHCGGGWDHSSFCDPRENVDVNRWAQNAKAGTAGRLRFAPMGENAEFFQKYYRDMLVFNGIDLQSNGHGGAALAHHTGGLSGLPSLNALYASAVADGLPMPWLLAGGITQHLGIQPFTRLPSDAQMRQLANANRRDTSRLYFRGSDMDIIDRYRAERLQAMSGETNNLPYTQRKLDELYDARTSRGMMDRLANALPDQLDNNDLKGDPHGMVNGIHRTLAAVQAGVCASASLRVNHGYDSHRDHDNNHNVGMTKLTRAVDYLWTKAEQMGIANRLVVLIASDVGRTPRYNNNNGKDHWSAGSSVIMMKNQPWTNRVVGISGPKHQKLKINPATLQEDANGIRLRTAHVHQALRTILGIENDVLSKKYAFDVAPIDVLNTGVTSPVNV